MCADTTTHSLTENMLLLIYVFCTCSTTHADWSAWGKGWHLTRQAESFIIIPRCSEMKSISSKSSINISQHRLLTPAVCSITIPAGLSRICLFQLIMPTLVSRKVINPNHCVHFHTCQTIIHHLAYLFSPLRSTAHVPLFPPLLSHPVCVTVSAIA